ncbi:hypothetical protein ACQUWL_20250 [Serratia marcescens]|uniref:hypothetical protein n=1 Tax=Serratia marcescens TaxID=615 RepID=UPI003D177069
MTHEHSLEQVVEMAEQAEVVLRLAEDYPSTLEPGEVIAIVSLVRQLTGRVVGWLEEEQAQRKEAK